MPVIALQGIRGGVGATALTAGLAWALHHPDEKVVALDLSPANQLGQHFNTPFGDTAGWLRAALGDDDARPGARRYRPGLDFIPCGELSAAERARFYRAPADILQPWLDQCLPALRRDYDWVLLDIPARLDAAALPRVDRLIQVIMPDANCHLRLHRATPAPGGWYLINQFSLHSAAQQDLHQLWSVSLRRRVPLTVHHDEAVAEAMLHKQPLGEYRPQSLAAEELNALAVWLRQPITE
ncbi:cellulose synthase operon protein YhjQ [Affinibrenneria salicis]|uniref:Cellulose synthase operon protein YhjQ n=1 Tax=Affinibrenneria salicis TaxID=2590031 RepID=A0A5J5G208_9GAMM|nr:cellulose biosynthesis protein BcsQ [Affinibrenneria salicis]KAA9000698.1 cellulose synthase operon protein YhjQ [Affinibrenneria salicis]